VVDFHEDRVIIGSTVVLRYTEGQIPMHVSGYFPCGCGVVRTHGGVFLIAIYNGRSYHTRSAHG
jgi:hypothetical protein